MFPKVDLPRQKGYPFAMAFCYMEGGTKVFTGDLWTIEKHLKNEPTHLGLVRIGKIVRPIVFGKLSYTRNVDRPSLYLSKMDISYDCEPEEYLKERKRQNLYLSVPDLSVPGVDSRIVIAKWRRIPTKYLPLFKELDAKYFVPQTDTIDA